MNSDSITLTQTNEPNLSVQFCDQQFSGVLMNASGCRCTSVEELSNLSNCNSIGAFISKSCTAEYRKGNELPRYHFDSDTKTSINSTGLANLGSKTYLDLPNSGIFTNKKGGQSPPYFVSIAGMSLDEHKTIWRQSLLSPVQFLEINLSCPNLVGHPQIGYVLDQRYSGGSSSLHSMLYHIVNCFSRSCSRGSQTNSGKKIGLKLPPYFDIIHFQQAADSINYYYRLYGLPNWVTCVNSIGNGLVVDYQTESAVIAPKGGLGGIGGPSIKPTALANVRKFRELLDPGIQIIGCGGVNSGQDVFEHILCGADLVQVGTTFQEEGLNCFSRISKELTDLMKLKGYKSVDEFKGTLKAIPN